MYNYKINEVINIANNDFPPTLFKKQLIILKNIQMICI